MNLIEQIKVNDVSIDGYQGTYYDDNPEWIQLTTDSSGRILSGRKKNGTVVENVGIDADEVTVDTANVNVLNLSETAINNLKENILQEEINKIIAPSNYYLLSGVNNDIFYLPILKKWNPFRYYIFADTKPKSRDYIKSIGRCVTLKNPTATSIVLNLYDNEKNDYIQAKTINFRKGTQGVGSSEIKVGIIGDSYTDGGGFTPVLLAHNYVPNLKLVGTRKVVGYSTQCTDGRSGWQLNTFFNVQTDKDYFNPFIHPQGSHRYWCSTAFWANVCSGFPTEYGTRYSQYATLCDNTGFPVNPVEGDVIYDSTNTSFKEYRSGSWLTVLKTDYTWEFNYSKYLSMWNIETPDILCVMLGINDFWLYEPSSSSLATWKQRIEIIKNSFLSANVSGKFVILTANTVTYNNVNHYNPFSVHRNMQKLREFVITQWDNKEDENVYVVDTAQLIDPDNAFTLLADAPFDGYPNDYPLGYLSNEYEYTSKEIWTNDGQHPRINYTTLGYSLAAFIQYHR